MRIVLGRLFLLFTLVPLVELYLLVSLGGAIGVWPTLALVGATGLFGAVLAKREGLRVLGSWQRSIAQGDIPREGLSSGALVLMGAVLLVTPGILTDVLGLALLFPPTRRGVSRWLSARVRHKLGDHIMTALPTGHPVESAAGTGTVIDLDADGVHEHLQPPPAPVEPHG